MAAPNPNETHTTPCPTNPNHAKAKTNGDTKIEINTELIMMGSASVVGNEGNSKITSWVEIVDKFFYKYYPLSRASKLNDANEFLGKGYDNITLFDDGESSDDDCDKSNL
ncbi:hypothetical protein Tco_0531921 [Tanacetum coccineum]